MRHSVSRATSSIAMLRRHGRIPTDEEVLEAYRELAVAKIEQCLRDVDERGLPLDLERSAYLQKLLSELTVDPFEVSA